MSRSNAEGDEQEWELQVPTALPVGAAFKYVLLEGGGQPRWEESRPDRHWAGCSPAQVHRFGAASPRQALELDAELVIAWGGPELKAVDLSQLPSAALHAFHWSFSEVQRRAPEVASQGFCSVQLSPAQRSIPGDEWWTRYQPVRYEEIHGLGSEHDLREACSACQKLGLSVLGDLVFNHMQVVASCDEWRQAQHDHGHLESLKRRLSERLGPTFNRNDFQWPWFALEGAEWDGPNRMEGWGCGEWSELQGGSPKVQSAHMAHMQQLKSCGVSGFRFDAAKHMRPQHIADYVQSAGVYAFGEVLSVDPAMQREYTDAVSVEGGPLPTTDFLLAVWLRKFLEAGEGAVDFDQGAWVKHLLDVEFGRKGRPPSQAGAAAKGQLQAPVLARNSVRFARNHDTVYNDVPFYGLGGWGQEGAQVAAAWLLAAHDGTVLLLPQDVKASSLIRQALLYRKALRAQLRSLGSKACAGAQTLIRARRAREGGSPLTVCLACRVPDRAADEGRLLGFCVLNPDAKGAAEFPGSACLTCPAEQRFVAADGTGEKLGDVRTTGAGAAWGHLLHRGRVVKAKGSARVDCRRDVHGCSLGDPTWMALIATLAATASLTFLHVSTDDFVVQLPTEERAAPAVPRGISGISGGSRGSVGRGRGAGGGLGVLQSPTSMDASAIQTASLRVTAKPDLLALLRMLTDARLPGVGPSRSRVLVLFRDAQSISQQVTSCIQSCLEAALGSNMAGMYPLDKLTGIAGGHRQRALVRLREKLTQELFLLGE
ncbi:unnamed protein product, partial [Polarella glacialis]